MRWVVGYNPTHLPMVENKKKGVICMVYKNKIKKEETEGYNIEMIDPYDLPSLWIYETEEKEKEALKRYLKEKYGLGLVSIYSITEWVDEIREKYKVHPRIETALNYKKLLKSEMVGYGAIMYKVGEEVYVCYP